MIIAFKTEELEDQPLASYIIIFDIEGHVYLEDKVPGNNKFEGKKRVLISNFQV
jgi:hypothetical protein